MNRRTFFGALMGGAAATTVAVTAKTLSVPARGEPVGDTEPAFALAAVNPICPRCGRHVPHFGAPFISKAPPAVYHSVRCGCGWYGWAPMAVMLPNSIQSPGCGPPSQKVSGEFEWGAAAYKAWNDQWGAASCLRE